MPPGSTDIVRILVDREVGVAEKTLELDGHAQAGHSSADDDDVFGGRKTEKGG